MIVLPMAIGFAFFNRREIPEKSLTSSEMKIIIINNNNKARTLLMTYLPFHVLCITENCSCYMY